MTLPKLTIKDVVDAAVAEIDPGAFNCLALTVTVMSLVDVADAVSVAVILME